MILHHNLVQQPSRIPSLVKTAPQAQAFRLLKEVAPLYKFHFDTQGTTSASCGPGEIATGGGHIADVPLIIVTSRAMPDNAGWTITAHNGGSTNSLSVSAFAECATIVS
jgi:hypothetical protein